MLNNDALTGMTGWLREENGFTLLAHISPDGDTLGSCLALYIMLSDMGKSAQIACEHVVPAHYAFLPKAGLIKRPEELQRTRNVILIDCAAADRVGGPASAFMETAEHLGVIDHHIMDRLAGEYILHDVAAAATGELVFDVYEALNRQWSGATKKEIATCIFTAISTDTGNFAYTNTRPKSFRIAANLLEMGADIADINRRIYRTVPLGKARLRAFVLDSMRFLDEGRIGYAVISLEDLERLGACVEDIEGMVENIRDVDTVEIAFVMRERKAGGYKASLRSKRYADVSKVATRFGGGGHKHAAGCDTTGDRDVFLGALLQAAQEAL